MQSVVYRLACNAMKEFSGLDSEYKDNELIQSLKRSAV
jgi:hypothetical protein